MRQSPGEIIKKLVSSLQGAPYPAAINNELYTIWYEHAQIAAQEGMQAIAERKRAATGGRSGPD